ncbi:MAG: ATP-dependent 6-phosphofructokinase [Rickettsiales bacterium]|jgi:6-phosphofructokinase 1|nr:ATP-dependent 6-phosphofructokinase [Rickettsiales bacterium]
MKRIAIITTGGDCSGLNAAIRRLVVGGMRRGYKMIGILDGTDGLVRAGAPNFMELTPETIPPEFARMSGSFLRNGHSHSLNFESAKKTGRHDQFASRMKKSLKEMNLDALIIIGGNGSLSLASASKEVYGNIQLIGIPKTIDMDIPMTDNTIGFATAVQSLTGFCDQLMLTARSHHRWFVVQTMGRDVGALALHAGIAIGADAILIPEVKFKPDALVSHLRRIKQEQNRDYGIILVAEGIKMRGHSGKPADMIARELSRADIPNRAAFPEHTQRAGDATAADRILSAQFADAALRAIENNETYAMVSQSGGRIRTIPFAEMVDSGVLTPDPNIPDMFVSNAYVPPDHPLLRIAVDMGIYIGEVK